ncbi:arginine--tRNA ligase [Isoalcanivorax beigongshangi]|uniref:Arginine--tRNA ligase n=1 Tax=Isoalcanivorax beigongshangi TaxID=3238810 RepID=A0ABV4AJG6_9GAMM
MKDLIIACVEDALATLRQRGVLPEQPQPPVQLEHTRDKSHGDFATNIAMMLAKPAGLKPRDLATAIVEALPAHPAIRQVDIAGPGFINFFQADDYLATRLQHALQDAHLGVRKADPARTVVVDYSGPNLAKEMHVGHLRSTIIGDAVARTLAFLGHRVIRQNHVGDWGTQFGMLLAYLEEQNQDQAELAAELADLEAFYRAAKLRFDDSPEFAQRARELVVALQSGDPHCLKMWQDFNHVSLRHCFDVYQRLGVSLTPQDVRGESAYNPELPKVVAALDDAGLLQDSDGARCVFLDDFKNKEGEPLPVIVQKADGGYLYATSDLAALRYRAGTLGADRILYFVDQRQALHFQQVFEVARKAGFVGADTDLGHMGFGTMNGADGKPFKTRTGGTVKLVDLLTEAEDRALALVRDKNPELDSEELLHIGHVVGISAVKYADLSKHRSSDYIFNFEQMLSFEGNTAPYLLYAYTRVASLFRRAGLRPEQLPDTPPQLSAEQELTLANLLVRFEEVLQQVADKGTPHVLCSYLYDLAGAFSSFYENCPVLAGDDAALRTSRLQLAALTARTLHTGLDLLGIPTLERM